MGWVAGTPGMTGTAVTGTAGGGDTAGAAEFTVTPAGDPADCRSGGHRAAGGVTAAAGASDAAAGGGAADA